MNHHDALLNDGFEREIIMWSFTPEFEGKDGGYYYSKLVPSEVKGSYTDQIEIGVILNTPFNSMQVFMCDCAVGCCGRNLGIFPFSIHKIYSLLEQERTRMRNIGNAMFCSECEIIPNSDNE